MELEDTLHLEILEMADPSLSLSEMVEEFVEGRLSREEEEEEDYAVMMDGEEDATWEAASSERYRGIAGEEEEEDEEEVDEEEMERRAVEAVTDDVLRGLRSLYFKRLIEFDVHDD